MLKLPRFYYKICCILLIKCYKPILMNFKLKAYRRLLQWKGKPGRKPLIIRGGRQVGKSTLVEQFAGEFRHYILLNMEKHAPT